MGETILVIVILILFALMFRIVNKMDSHYKWFNNLKPGDMILVTIYSNSCECHKEAMVISEPKRKYVEAQMSTDVIRTCKH